MTIFIFNHFLLIKNNIDINGVSNKLLISEQLLILTKLERNYYLNR